MADQQHLFKESRETWEALLQRHEEVRRVCKPRNAEIRRAAAGTRAKRGDPELGKRVKAVLAKKGMHPKLSHEHWTGPWEVKEFFIPGLSFNIAINV